MILPMRCEYCGTPTPWDLDFHVPPCCDRCLWIPLTLGVSLGLVSLAMIVAALVALWRLP